MSFMLASVNSLEEASLAHRLNVDIIDLKQPALGALGALPVEMVRTIVLSLPSTAQISATVGDLPMQRDLLCQAVQKMAATGVDYIKIGFFPDGDCMDCLLGLSQLARQNHKLIAVLFADASPDLEIIVKLAEAGFTGVMLDTMNKQRGSLTEIMSLAALQDFVRTVKQHELLVGLAGSLSVSDIADLLCLKPDYLGFRGALCQQSCRTAQLDELQMSCIRQLMPGNKTPQAAPNITPRLARS